MLIQDENQNDAVNTNDTIYKYKCKIPPRIRTTRAGQANDEPILRNMSKFYDIKDKDGIESVDCCVKMINLDIRCGSIGQIYCLLLEQKNL